MGRRACSRSLHSPGRSSVTWCGAPGTTRLGSPASRPWPVVLPSSLPVDYRCRDCDQWAHITRPGPLSPVSRKGDGGSSIALFSRGRLRRTECKARLLGPLHSPPPYPGLPPHLLARLFESRPRHRLPISRNQSILAHIPHLAQTSDAVNRQLSCFSSRYMNLLAVFQI